MVRPSGGALGEVSAAYRDELDANPGAWEAILDKTSRGTVTLLYSAHDTVHNGAAVLCEYLLERPTGRSSRSVRTRARPSRGRPE